MSAIATHPEAPSRSVQLRIRAASARTLAAVQLHHGLSLASQGLGLQLMYVVDADLLESDPMLRERALTLAKDYQSLFDRLYEMYPGCHSGGATHLLRREGITLAQETELYRQENFWSQPGRDALIKSEELIRDIHRFYRCVATFVRLIDLTDEDTDHERKYPEFRACPNPYVEIIGD